MFQQIATQFGPFEVDLFASRLKRKVPIYFSWTPDPHSTQVDAFTVQWDMYTEYYAFPPFSLIQRCLTKIQTTVTMVLPLWPTQPWFPVMLNHHLPLTTTRRQPSLSTLESIHTVPAEEILKNAFCEIIWTTIADRGIPEITIRFTLGRFSAHMLQAYGGKTMLWQNFCTSRQINPLNLNLIDLTDFFTHLGLRKNQKITIATMRSFLTHILSAELVKGKIIDDLTKGIQKANPSLPRINTSVWNIKVVVDFLASWPHYSKLSLMELSQKTLVLILLSTMLQKCEAHRLSIAKMTRSAEDFTFLLTIPGKNYSDSYNACQEFRIRRFARCPDKCPYIALAFYFKATKEAC